MPAITLKASGAQAPDDMRVGEWIVRCGRGEISQRGNKISAVLTCLVLGRFTENGFVNDNEGVVLKQWYFLSKRARSDDDVAVEIEIQPHSKYGIAWALATGRPLKSADDPSPTAFENKIFRVDVGFSSAVGGSFSYRNVGKKKDPRDFLRIHSIVERIEENALSHMTPYEDIGAYKHVHVNEHGHEHDARASTGTQTRAVTPTSAVAVTSNKVVRMDGTSHKGDERVPQGHANLAPGDSEKKGITENDVLQTFPGAKVNPPVERQFRALATKGSH